MYEMKRAKPLSQAMVHLVEARANCSRTIKYQVCQCGTNTGILEPFVSILVAILQQIPILLRWINGHQGMELQLLVCVVRQLVISLHTFLCMTFHIIGP